MTPWLLGLGLVVVEATLCYCAWMAWKRLRQVDAQLEIELAAIALNHETLRSLLAQIRDHLTAPKPPEPETGAFLPSDEDAARMETMLRSSEDRFISGRPTPSSFAPTTTSRSNSRPGRSTPPARNSGPR